MFRAKKIRFGINGKQGQWSKFTVKNAIVGIADTDLPIRYANFMGLR